MTHKLALLCLIVAALLVVSPFSVAQAAPNAQYFYFTINSQQTYDLSGLPCVVDQNGQIYAMDQYGAVYWVNGQCAPLAANSAYGMYSQFDNVITGLAQGSYQNSLGVTPNQPALYNQVPNFAVEIVRQQQLQEEQFARAANRGWSSAYTGQGNLEAHTGIVEAGSQFSSAAQGIFSSQADNLTTP